MTCRDCGAIAPPGAEDTTDLMPGVCPSCFEDRVAPIFAAAQSYGTLILALIAAGCHPQRIVTHLEAQRGLLRRLN